MSTDPIFICSFCAKSIRVQTHQLGMSATCPACNRRVILLENQKEAIDYRLTTHWYYRKLRLLFGTKEVGPILDTELLSLIRQSHIDASTEVRSPEGTRDEWVSLGQVNVAIIQERIDQRIAEQQRRTQLMEKKRQVDRANREKLQRAIRGFVEDGTITLDERQTAHQFALAAGIPDAEVQRLLVDESVKLISELFEEAVADGILDPLEEQRLGQIATRLGVFLPASDDNARRIEQCRVAYQLNSGTFVPPNLLTVPLKLAAKESIQATTEVSWHEVVTAKRPSGIALGNDRYLKPIGTGTAYLTNKQVMMVTAFDSKKFTLASVQRVTRYSDGLFFNRSTGKSIFLALDPRSTGGGRFSLVSEFVSSGDPVLGYDPTHRFVPDVIDCDAVEIIGDVEESPPYPHRPEPRYTFRVVGDHIGNRAFLISRLRPGRSLFLFREPANPFDANAVAVYDEQRNQLGYLKREVAEWFAPLLDRGRHFTAAVHALTSAGSLIVGVFE